MNPGAEALAASDMVPSLLGASVRMAIAVAVLVAAAWVLLRWRKKVRAPQRDLEVLDRVFLTRGASAALLRVGARRMLVGVSADGVRLLRELDAAEPAAAAPAFGSVLAEATSDRERAG